MAGSYIPSILFCSDGSNMGSCLAAYTESLLSKKALTNIGDSLYSPLVSICESLNVTDKAISLV